MANIQRYRIPDSLTESSGTITATFNGKSFSILPNYGSLAASTRYQVYMVPGGTLEVSSLELSQAQNDRILVGSFYTSVNTTFLQFTDINLPEFSNLSEIIDVTGSGDFTSGSTFVSRQGNMVSITDNGVVLQHPNGSNASTAPGLLPPWAIPDTGQSAVWQMTGAQIFRIFVNGTGDFVFEYRDYNGAGSNRTNSSSYIIIYPFSIVQSSITPIKDL